MHFRDTCLPHDIDDVKIKEASNEVLNLGRFRELDFVEPYLDADGILHIKTFFTHSDLDESELWEVFVPQEGSHPLELLLPENE
mgnify:CR=1 FL=1